VTITRGRADGGGGIENLATLTMTNCTLSGNVTSGSGGGLVNRRGPLTLTKTIGAGLNNEGTTSPTNAIPSARLRAATGALNVVESTMSLTPLEGATPGAAP
jgi:hypothetical protein